DKQAGSNFSQRRQSNKSLNEWIEPVGKERQHYQNKNRIDGLNLGRQPLDAEKMSIHRLGLNDPRRKILLPQRPEDRDERHRHQNVEDSFAGLLVKNLPGISSHADRRNVNEFLSTHPKDNRGDGHEDTGQPEGDVRTMQAGAFKKTDNRRWEFCDETARLGFVGVKQPRNQKRRNERPGVDRKIKPIKDARKQM